MKERILTLLKDAAKEHPGEYVSGELLSQSLSVTRAAVWKGVRQLEEDGYTFESRTRHGYRLTGCPDIPYPWELSPLLKPGSINWDIRYYREVGSTNDVALELCAGRPAEGLVVTTSSQTKGKGRLEEGWESPVGQGLYFSLALTPAIPMARMGEVTALVAEAAAECIQAHTGFQPEFRMPGDIRLNGGKVCGILTEGVGELERVRYVVTGVGINLFQERNQLPEGYTSLLAETGERVSLCGLFADLLNRIEEGYSSFITT